MFYFPSPMTLLPEFRHCIYMLTCTQFCNEFLVVCTFLQRHSNISLTLYRNYQRTVLQPGVALLLATANHEYEFLTAPTARLDTSSGRVGEVGDGGVSLAEWLPAPGILTDGSAYSQTEGCVRFAKSDHASRIRLNLTTASEDGLDAPFRLAAGFRAYFLHLDGASDGAKVPDAVSVACTFGWSGSSNAAAPMLSRSWSRTVLLTPVTKYPSKGKMVIYDAHLLDEVLEATTCEFTIEHSKADVLLAEIEVYE